LGSDLGFRIKADEKTGRYEISGPAGVSFAAGATNIALEHDQKLIPLSSMHRHVENLVQVLSRPGERLPLVVHSCQRGPFRVAAAMWVGLDGPVEVTSFTQLTRLINEWNGRFPDQHKWQECDELARDIAEKQVAAMERHFAEVEKNSLAAQVEAAQLRLMYEVGRYLIAAGAEHHDLNNAWYSQMSREISGAARLRDAHERLGGYPEWPEIVMLRLEYFARNAPADLRRGLLMGSQLDAALADPRWTAMQETSDARNAA
jgi:hypothetical protein